MQVGPCVWPTSSVYIGRTLCCRTSCIQNLLEVRTADAPDLQRQFETAYEQCWRPVYRFAVAWTNDQSAAEEIAQETLLRLWKGRDSIDWSSPVLPWLLVVARRLATDRFRKLRRQMRRPTVMEMTMDEGMRATWLDVQSAFARLSPHERTAIVSVTILGLSPAEVAAVLGISPGAVRSAVSRARLKLQDRS